MKNALFPIICGKFTVAMDKKKVFWAVLSLLIAFGSIFMVIRQSENFSPDLLIEYISDMDDKWLLLAFVGMFGFILFEGLAIVRILKSIDSKKYSRTGLLYAASDIYFSAVTPSASGGQPASAFFMHKDGMNKNIITITLVFNLMMYNLALFTIGVLAVIFLHGSLLALSIESIVLFAIGSVLLIFLVLGFYMLLKHDRILYFIADKMLIFLERIKIIRKADNKRARLRKSMSGYRDCAEMIANDKKMVLDVFLLSIAQRLSQFSVTFCVFMGMQKGLATSLHAMAMQTFVAISSNSLPIPGGMGVADYVMLDIFKHMALNSEPVHVELMCRGITFYGAVITGGIITCIGYIRVRREELKEMNELTKTDEKIRKVPKTDKNRQLAI